MGPGNLADRSGIDRWKERAELPKPHGIGRDCDHNRKGVLTDEGTPELAVPRDRAGRFEARLVEQYCQCLPGFDDKVISIYARGMTTRDIRGHIEELYRGVGVGGTGLEGHRFSLTDSRPGIDAHRSPWERAVPGTPHPWEASFPRPSPL